MGESYTWNAMDPHLSQESQIGPGIVVSCVAIEKQEAPSPLIYILSYK
jgi:hypothetical protein